MRIFLRFLCGLFVFMGYGLADGLQVFLDGVVKLQRTYEKREISGEQYFMAIKSLVSENLTQKDIRVICETEIPSRKNFHKMRKKHWVGLERKLFTKILLLALYGRPIEANALLRTFEDFLSRQDVPSIVPTHRSWIILLNCIDISYRPLIRNYVAGCIGILTKWGKYELSLENYKKLWQCVRSRVKEDEIKTCCNIVSFCETFLQVNHCIEILRKRGFGITPEWSNWLWQEVNKRVKEGAMKTYEDAVVFCETLLQVNYCIEILREKGFRITPEWSNWLWQKISMLVEKGMMKTYEDAIAFCRRLIYKNCETISIGI